MSVIGERSSEMPQGDERSIETLRAALGAHYTLERELGHGGMATVYLAHDVRHGRHVAVKVLRQELAAVLGATRFLAEIRTTAALQHPHILPLFDSGEAAGQLYYVMPYVEGETLRARLTRERQLPVADAVRIATEVASALDYAHRRGVVHRDVKPENILLGDGGQALVADFGIALAVSNAGGDRVTQTGLSLGTPQYMAPEQAAAERAVDARVDVYALGAVTYEMLAGEPPFSGASAQVIIAKLMTEEPQPLATLRRSVPPHTELAVRIALQKLPADRFASASSFAAALAEPTATRDWTTRLTRPMDSRRQHPAVLAAIGVGLLASGVALGMVAARTNANSAVATRGRGPVRFVVEPDSGFLGTGVRWHGGPAISPDGQTVVYAATAPGGGARLYARRVGDISARVIAGSEDGDWPFFSPDGTWLAFASRGAIRKVRLDGGTPIIVAELLRGAGRFFGGSWGPDDTITYTAFLSGALYRVPAAGGIPTRIAVVDTARRLMYPNALPGGKALLVTSSTDWRVGRIGVLDLATGKVRQFGSGTGARYVAGYIVYAGAGGALYRQPFDLNKLAPTGSAEEIVTGVDVFWAAISPFDVSQSGSLIYLIGRGGWTVSTIDRSGRRLQDLPGLFAWSPRFSPDGRRVAYSALTPGRDGGDMWSQEVWHTDILITELASGTMHRLTTDGNDNNEPVWSPDGRFIAFDAGLLGTKDLYMRALDGDSVRLLVRRPGNQFTADWVPDGGAVLFSDNGDIWVQPVNGGAPRPYVTGPGTANSARLSPNGRWMAYASDETGRFEIYLQSYPTPGRKVLISDGGGANPAWRQDGRELYYWQDDRLIAVSLESQRPEDLPQTRTRTLLFEVPRVGDAGYDVSPDGTRFVIITGGPRADRLVVALDALGANGGSEKSRR